MMPSGDSSYDGKREHGLSPTERQSAVARIAVARIAPPWLACGCLLVRRRRAQLSALGMKRERLHTTLTSIGDGDRLPTPPCDLMNGGPAPRLDDAGSAGEVFHIVNEQTSQPVESPVTKSSGRECRLANHTPDRQSGSSRLTTAPPTNAGRIAIGVAWSSGRDRAAAGAAAA